MTDKKPIPLLSRYRDLPYARILVWFRGGSSVEENEELGWAHLIEHLLFKLRHHDMTIAEFIEATGGSTNAFTSHDALVIEATVRNEDAHKTLRFLEKILEKPLSTIEEHDFEHERAVVLEELRLYEDDPNERLLVEVMRHRYPGHPYGREIIGTKSSLQKATLPALEIFFRKKLFHDPFVVIAGGYRPEKSLSFVLCPPPPSPNIESWPSDRRITLFHEQSKNYLLAAWRLDTLDPAHIAALRLLYTIAYDMEGSRFRDRLVYEKNTLDSLSMILVTGISSVSFLQNAVFPSSHASSRMRRWAIEWEDLTITQAEIARAREVILSDECFAAEGIGNLAETMGISWLAVGDPNRLERDVFWHISHLTANDLNAFKREHLSLEKAILGLSSPVNHRITHFPSLDKSDTVVTARTREPATLIKSKPGVRILFRHANHAPFVSLYALKKSGVFADPPRRGGALRLMLETLVTTAHGLTREKTDEFLDRFGITLEPVFGNNTGGIRLTVRDTFLPEALDILKRILANPLHAEDFAHEKEHTLSRLSLKRESPSALLKEKIHEVLFSGTPYDHPPEGTAASVTAITFADVRRIRTEFFRKGRWSLGISGAVEKEFAQEIAALLPVASTSLATYSCRSRAVLDDRIISVTVPGRKQRHIVRLFKAPGVRDDSFEVMRFTEQALLGQRSPLFQRLREEEGLVYTFDVWGMGGLTEGYMAIYAVTSPEKATSVMDRIERTLDDFRKRSLHATYFDEVKNALLFEHARSSIHNEYHAFNLALEDALGLPQGSYLKQPEKISAITLDDLTACAENYFSKGLWLISEDKDHD